jgi:hypothetical protein
MTLDDDGPQVLPCRGRGCRRIALAFALLVAPLLAACAADAQADGSTHADNPHNPNPTQGLGAGGAVGPAPRDMPGGGRGSSTPKGK